MSRASARLLPAALLVALAVGAVRPSLAAQQDAPPGARAGAPPGAGDPAGGFVIRPYGPQYGFPDAEDPSRFIWVFLDGVEAVQPGRKLRGDTLVIVLATGAGAAPLPELPVPPTPPTPGVPPGEAPADAGVVISNDRLLEFYLDGNVSVEEGDEIISGASAFLLDNATGVATVLQGHLHSEARGRPLAIRYETLRRLQDGTSEMTGLQATGCSYGHPHWHLDMPRATLTPGPDGRILDTSSIRVRAGDVPVFWWPGVHINLDRDSLLIRRLSLGSRSRFGTVVSTAWEGDAGPLASGVAGWFGSEEELAAEWNLEANWYSQRGFFFAPSFDYHGANSKGRLLVAYINDTAEEDHLGQPIDDNRRGRIQLRHRTRIDAERTLDVEVSRQGDRNFLNEYYEDEFKEGKEQQTYVSYRKVVDDHAFTVLASTRLNDFDTQVEYQPHVTWRTAGHPLGNVIFGDAFLTMRDFISNARLLPDDDTADPSIRNLRLGSVAEVNWPLDLPNGDRLRVLVGADLTGFEDTVSDGGEVRSSATGGAVWSRTYSGVEEAHSEDWNLDGLRRIVEPFVGYFNRFALSHEPEELLPIDSIEQERRVETLTFGVRDRIQTHQGGKVVTILDSELSLPLYPKADRDNDGETVGLISLDTRWAPHANVILLRDTLVHWRLALDPNTQHYDSSYLTFSTGFGPGRRLQVSRNAVFHEFDFVTLAVQWLLNDKWTVATFYQHDARTGARVKQGFLLRQLAHCWFIDYEVAVRRGESGTGDDKDEVRASINFQPAFVDAEQDLTQSIGGKYP